MTKEKPLIPTTKEVVMYSPVYGQKGKFDYAYTGVNLYGTPKVAMSETHAKGCEIIGYCEVIVKVVGK